MSHALLLGLRSYIPALISLVESCARPDPSGLSSVVVDVVGSAQMILATLPAIWQSSLSILESAVCTAAVASWSRSIWRGAWTSGRASWWASWRGLTETLGSWLAGD